MFYVKTSAGEDGEVKNEPELTGTEALGQLYKSRSYLERIPAFLSSPSPPIFLSSLSHFLPHSVTALMRIPALLSLPPLL